MRSMRELLILILLCLGFAQAGKSQTLALTGATIIDGNGGAPIHDGVIVVKDKRIVAVGPRGSVSVPAGAREVKLGGKYIVPGLMDANVHFVSWPGWEHIEFLARYENNFDGLVEEAAQVALKYGFTTVFDSMGPMDPLMRVRDRINRGEIPGSRMFIAGDIVGFRAVFTTSASMEAATPAFQKRINAMFEKNGGPDLSWKTPDQVREEMTKYVALGVDFVKYGANGDGRPINSSTGEENVLRFTPEQQRAMVEAVHAAGKIIQTHQESAEGLKSVLDAGVDMAQHCSITHASRIDDATIQRMLDKKFYCGTQWRLLTDEEKEQVRDNKFRGSDADNGKEHVSYNLENEVRLIKAGVPLLVSTDASVLDPDITAAGGFVGTPLGEGEFLDMRAMHQRGMTNMAILQGATKNIAAAYHKQDQIGTLEPGKMADLVVLDADPLEDIENIRKMSLVMKEGSIIDTAVLPLHPILTSAEATNPGAVRMK
jgi:imidazolonepropionase-like amidohydrolase